MSVQVQGELVNTMQAALRCGVTATAILQAVRAGRLPVAEKRPSRNPDRPSFWYRVADLEEWIEDGMPGRSQAQGATSYLVGCRKCGEGRSRDGESCPTCGSTDIFAEPEYGPVTAANGPAPSRQPEPAKPAAILPQRLPAAPPPAPAAEKPAQAVALSGSRSVRRWHEATRALCAELSAELERVQAEFAVLEQRRAALRQQLGFVTRVLEIGQVDETGALPAPRPAGAGKPGPKPGGRWAREHDACRECGTTAERHFARGYCSPCYRLAKKAGRL